MELLDLFRASMDPEYAKAVAERNLEESRAQLAAHLERLRAEDAALTDEERRQRNLAIGLRYAANIHGQRGGEGSSGGGYVGGGGSNGG